MREDQAQWRQAPSGWATPLTISVQLGLLQNMQEECLQGK